VLDKPEEIAVKQVLLSLAGKYPQALSFPVMLCADRFESPSPAATASTTTTTNSCFALLHKTVISDHMRKFVSELKRVTSPYTAYMDWLDEQEAVVKRGDADALLRGFKHLKHDLLPMCVAHAAGRATTREREGD